MIFDWQQSNLLNSNNVYFLHPSLHNELCERNPFYRVNKICGNKNKSVIGNGCEWPFVSDQIFPQVFISYSSHDKEFIERCLPMFDHYLSLKCPYNIFYDKWNIKVGQDIYQEGSKKELKESDIVILFVSNNSLKSGWVEAEWQSKHSIEIKTRDIKVIAVIIDDTGLNTLPLFLKSKLFLRLSDAPDSEFPGIISKLAQDVWITLENSHCDYIG